MDKPSYIPQRIIKKGRYYFKTEIARHLEISTKTLNRELTRIGVNTGRKKMLTPSQIKEIFEVLGADFD
jgi:hypothetical protein